MSRGPCLVATLAALAGAPACLLTNDFFGLEDVAPVVAVERPEAFPGGGFGASLAGYESAALGGLVAVGGNTGTDVYVFQSTKSTGRLFPDAEFARMCEDRVECEGRGFGRSFVWMSSFALGTDCGVMGAPLTDSVFAFCLDGSFLDSATTPARSSLGTSIAGAVDGTEVFVGAPASDERVYVWADADRATLVGVGLGLGGTIGEAVAAIRIDGETVRVAAGGGGEVVVFNWADGAATLVGEPRLGSAGFGSVLAWGDSMETPGPELYAGGGGQVRVYSGATLDDVRSLDCEGDCASFGDAIAVGDVTDDGRDEIVVGWPARASSGKSFSGAVAVYAHDATTAPEILTDSTPEADEELGRAVAVVPVGDRNEIAAGAGGEILWFLCSGLVGDGPEVGERCRP